jgi:hypothetical protein
MIHLISARIGGGIIPMKEMRIPHESFDAEAFLARAIEFLGKQVSPEVDPTYAIVRVENSENMPVFGPGSEWGVLSALRQEGKIVFFPFAYPDTDGTLICADGNTCGPAFGEDGSTEQLLVGLEDSVGYLVRVQHATLIINSAIHAGGGCSGPAPRVDLYPDCGVLDGPMENFIRSFIEEG